MMATAITRRTQRLKTVQWFIDIMAASYIIYTTAYRRSKLRENSDWTPHGNRYDIDDFLIYNLAAWVASAILEFRTCIDFICLIKQEWNINCLTKISQVLLSTGLLLFNGISSCIMLWYSYSVLMSFKEYTRESNVYFYFVAAAAAKNLRIIFQGEQETIHH